MASPFSLNAALDPELLARRFRVTGRVHIPAFLKQEDAERLHRHLRGAVEWRLAINQQDKLFELDRPAQAALAPDARAALDQAIHAEARYGFQFCFESIRVPDDEAQRAGRADPLNQFASFLSSAPIIALLRQITGCRGINFADAQATAYGPGHFLTAHDDAVAGKNRHAAYVLGLSPRWRVDWGGLLVFHGDDGHVPEAFTPAFNTLNVFKVPQTHSVSMVTPFAPARRYSVTGWLRGAN